MTPRRLKIQGNFYFSKITLKLEDKIILGIGALFLVSLLIFISLANRIFNHFEEQNKRWDQSIQKTMNSHNLSTAQRTQPPQATSTSQPATQKRKNLSSEEAFHRVAKAFEENRKKRDAAFKEMEENFKEQFKKAAEAHEKRGKHLFKLHDEGVARAQAAFDKKAAVYSASLPKYATSKKHGEKQHDSHK